MFQVPRLDRSLLVGFAIEPKSLELDRSCRYWDVVWNYPGSNQPKGMMDM